MARVLPLLLLLVCGAVVLAIVATGGNGATFEPFGAGETSRSSGAGETPRFSSGDRRVVVSSTQRFVEMRWRAAGRSGAGRLVARSAPQRSGARRFTFVLRGVPDGRVTVELLGLLPFETRATARLASGQRSRAIRIGPSPESCGIQNPGPCGRPPQSVADDGNTAHVAPDGNDSATGALDRPLRSIAKALAKPGVRAVVLHGGIHPRLTDDRRREQAIVIRGVGGTRPQIQGAALTGSGLHFQNVTFTAAIEMGGGRPVTDVVVSDSELTTGGTGTCLVIRAGTSNVRVTGSWIHDCHNGITGPYSGNEVGPESSHIEVTGNLMERFVADAIQFTDWRDVVISRNLIREMHAGAADDHNDGVQIVGGSSRVRITANEMHSSDNQLILVSDALGGPNADILVENNLLWGAGSWIIGNYGAAQMRIVNNTAWDSRAGALILGQAPGGDRRVERDTIVVNNVLSHYAVQDGAAARVQVGNVLAKTTSFTRSAGIRLRNPGFVSAPKNHYALRRNSPARGRASRSRLPPRDLLGLPRNGRRNPGAFR